MLEIKGPMFAEVPAHLAEAWTAFDVDDIKLFTSYFLAMDDNDALLICSVNSRFELWQMLETVGYYYCVKGVSVVLFRSVVPSVIKAAVRLHAIGVEKTGHKMRFILRLDFAPEFFDLCAQVYRRALRKKLFRVGFVGNKKH